MLRAIEKVKLCVAVVGAAALSVRLKTEDLRHGNPVNGRVGPMDDFCSKVQGSWVVEQCHWPTAVEAQKYGGCLLSRRAECPDNVVALDSGAARPGLVSCGLARLAAARGTSTICIRPSRRGGGDEDHPSFLTQALHPQPNYKVRASHLPGPSRPNLLVGVSVLHFAAHTVVITDGSDPGRAPITVASAPEPHELSIVSHGTRTRAGMRGHDEVGERLFRLPRPVHKGLHGQARVEIGMNMRGPA